MTITRAIGSVCNAIVVQIVNALKFSKIHPNVLTLIGLLINLGAAYYLATGGFFAAGWIITGAAIFDMVDGRVALKVALFNNVAIHNRQRANPRPHTELRQMRTQRPATNQQHTRSTNPRLAFRPDVRKQLLA
jgi:hypothetical protein